MMQGDASVLPATIASQTPICILDVLDFKAAIGTTKCSGAASLPTSRWAACADNAASGTSICGSILDALAVAIGVWRHPHVRRLITLAAT